MNLHDRPQQDATWMPAATCRDLDLDLFFREDGVASTNAAKAICRECPVQTQCLTYALDASEEFGVWGGLTGRERRALLRGRVA